MAENFKYYVMKRKGDQAYPLLKIVGRDFDENNKLKLVYLEINTPKPNKPVLADFLHGPEVILSKRIATAIQKMNMEGIQFVPTQLTLKKDEIIEDYICVLFDNNTYEALDKGKAIFTKDDDFPIWNVEKIVLDKKILEQILLNNRLGFRLKEAPGYGLFHESVIEKISALNPTGVFFVDIEKYAF